MSSAALLHPRNPHQGRYNFTRLTNACPALLPYLRQNPAGDSTIDFTDPAAVIALNQALLASYYQVKYWQLPADYLCPPIPGRADYIHYLADLLARANKGVVPTGKQIRVLDIGTGANCIYPIIASQAYGWQVTGTDIDPVAVKAAALIVASNTALKSHVDIVMQSNATMMFQGLFEHKQSIHLTLCNPPFYASAAEAAAASARKWSNLGKETQGNQRNFAGQHHELWCEGGELKFISQMVTESQLYKQQVCWFSTLVSQQKHIPVLTKLLRSVNAVQTQVIEMRQGQKVSRILAWSFLNQTQQQSLLTNDI